MIYTFYFYVFVVDPARLCRHRASAGFCDVTEDVFIVPSSESECRERACFSDTRSLVLTSLAYSLVNGSPPSGCLIEED